MSPQVKGTIQGIALAACPIVFAVMIIYSQNKTNNNVRAVTHIVGRLVDIADLQSQAISNLNKQTKFLSAENEALKAKIKALEEKPK